MSLSLHCSRRETRLVTHTKKKKTAYLWRGHKWGFMQFCKAPFPKKRNALSWAEKKKVVQPAEFHLRLIQSDTLCMFERSTQQLSPGWHPPQDKMQPFQLSICFHAWLVYHQNGEAAPMHCSFDIFFFFPHVTIQLLLPFHEIGNCHFFSHCMKWEPFQSKGQFKCEVLKW